MKEDKKAESYPTHKEKCYRCGYEREAGFFRFEWTCPKCGEYNL